MQNKEIEHFMKELASIRSWTYKAEQVCKHVSEYKLPIVTPMKDLAIPIASLDKAFVQSFLNDKYCLHTGNEPHPYIKKVKVLKKEGDDNTEEPINSHNTSAELKEDLNKICIRLNQDDQEDSIKLGDPSVCVSSLPLSTSNKGSKGKSVIKYRKRTTDSEDNLPILEKLKAHPCTTKHMYNPTTKRMNKVITCNYDGCGKQFTKTWNVLDHFKVHTGEKPYKCEACKRAFSQKGNLTKHLKLHSKCSKFIKENC